MSPRASRRHERLQRQRVRQSPAQSDSPADNRLLARLPAAILHDLEPHLELVHLDRRATLFRAHEPLRVSYFPTTALVSLVSTLDTGQSLEVGLVGRDGVAGTSLFPGIATMSCDGIVQIPGLACRIAADVLRRESLANETLYSALGRFAQVLLMRSMHMSVCNMFHSAEQRCIRWLLAVNDLTDHDDIPLTHDLMATALGVHRPTVTNVIRSLHKAGLIHERRGRILIRDRAGLERSSCGCYRLMREEQNRLLGY